MIYINVNKNQRDATEKALADAYWLTTTTQIGNNRYQISARCVGQ